MVTEETNGEKMRCPFQGQRSLKSVLLSPASPVSPGGRGGDLFGGYSWSPVPDFAHPGTGSDERLRRCLLPALSRAARRPALGEPTSEAVWVRADVVTDPVPLAGSQRLGTGNKRGKRKCGFPRLVSNRLHSTLQLDKHSRSPNCVRMCEV